MTTFNAAGRTASGYLAVPPSGEGPGVLVLHAWWGLNSMFEGLCDQLAAAGFVAFAPDMFEGKRAETIEQAQALVKQSDGAAVEAIVTGSAAFLLDHPAVHGSALGALGFSYGAAQAVELSIQQPQHVAAVVVYYGAYVPDFAPAQAAYLGNFAANDHLESAEDVQAMEQAIRDAGRAVQFYIYPDTGHWFAEPDRPEYNQAAAEHALNRTIAFLREHLHSNES